ncbi:hypothetical protein [Alcaligenes faecalis]|uniref:hypothetical protein n=1 Tax=Alcaligenes faecalis TaxID=511 RepID=UPI00214F61A6|nr:hypothetical protein [Alcaligenes faecalis]MCR4143673.1 hypothetical protein [Alcaligenes faecalis]WGQ35351.1 hypothetical protein QEZ63_16005 [Alcaligenes faecalis]
MNDRKSPLAKMPIPPATKKQEYTIEDWANTPHGLSIDAAPVDDITHERCQQLGDGANAILRAVQNGYPKNEIEKMFKGHPQETKMNLVLKEAYAVPEGLHPQLQKPENFSSYIETTCLINAGARIIKR